MKIITLVTAIALLGSPVFGQQKATDLIVGTWKSNRELSVPTIKLKIGMTPERMKFLNNLFGRLEVTYTKTEESAVMPAHDDRPEWRFAGAYSVVSATDTEIVIKSKSPLTGEEETSTATFEGPDRYWIPLKGMKGREYFDRVKSPGKAATAQPDEVSASESKKAPDTRLFELRTYHAMPGKLDNLLARFRNHTTRLFKKHGMTNIGYWVPVENKDNILVYLLAYPDRTARDAAWKRFGADEDWKKAAAASEMDGKLVGKVDQQFLTATDFSPGFGTTFHEGERLFEMRTYTTTRGNLPALHNRFRNHTMKLFSNHGMTNLGYFQPVVGQSGADYTLLYFLAHKDAASAGNSWEGFRANPAWMAVKQASEDAVGGSLTVPDGVKSIFLKPTDFSPVR